MKKFTPPWRINSYKIYYDDPWYINKTHYKNHSVRRRKYKWVEPEGYRCIKVNIDDDINKKNMLRFGLHNKHYQNQD